MDKAPVVARPKEEPSKLTKFVNESIAKREKAVAKLIKEGVSSTEAKYAVAEKFKAEANVAVRTSLTGSIKEAFKASSTNESRKADLFDTLLKGRIISKIDSEKAPAGAKPETELKGLVDALKSRIVDLDI